MHQFAHERLHKGERRGRRSKTVRETEAEAVAFAVTTTIGLDTNTAAADYIQLYNGDKQTRPIAQFHSINRNPNPPAVSPGGIQVN